MKLFIMLNIIGILLTPLSFAYTYTIKNSTNFAIKATIQRTYAPPLTKEIKAGKREIIKAADKIIAKRKTCAQKLEIESRDKAFPAKTSLLIYPQCANHNWDIQIRDKGLIVLPLNNSHRVTKVYLKVPCKSTRWIVRAGDLPTEPLKLIEEQ
ncbi:hypothetical protein KG892_03075 [Vermiphilus pyriformis]|jgi:hypothetical protein|uniref:Uncharacterized protein n=1 Tax=candidate division TM6 bacterium JCVI TM6SC1 TaxID=1306947 RepID=A0A0D2I2H5_9BACT|nr:hypothetical protein J120_00170 [candidate division TM6 bacterium JCVI TM6SC1]UNE34960.1 MAG: hypothetical protein KG892_03075 [Vermiphilus pyriformis]